jgi:hypothetical protein
MFGTFSLTRLKKERVMKSSVVIFLITGLLLSSCGNSETSNENLSAANAPTQSAVGSTATSGTYSRETFVLCPALDPYRAELGAMVGIPQNEEPIQDAASRLRCVLRGVESGAWLRVEVQPAFIKPEQLQPDVFDAPATQVPELGKHGWYISDQFLRRVVFAMGPLVLQIEAESNNRPDEAAMVAVSAKIRDILAQANQ